MAPCALFVYGTLKRDQLRGSMWPRKPIAIRDGMIQADLYDLGSYPAITHGEGWVLGELWEFDPKDLPITLKVLDQIEDYDPSQSNNLYVRRIVSVQIADDDQHSARDEDETVGAYTYIAGDWFRPQAYRKIEPQLVRCERFVSAWPDASSRVPKTIAQEEQS